jgi:NAD(P)H dehydrogenase (quinone)
MILVTAAFGHQGKLLVPKLAAAGYIVRAARMTAGKDEELKRLGASEVFVGDLSDVDTYRRALDGVDAVYHIGPAGLHTERQMGFAMIEAAKRAGVRHVVFSSLLHPIVDILQHRYKRDIEEALIESGLKFTVLKPCDFMMPEVYLEIPMRTGEYPVYWSENPRRVHSVIAMEDLTDVAVKVLHEREAHYFASYELAGPDKLDSFETARILSRVMGREIRSVQKEPEHLMRALWGEDNAGEELRHRKEMFRSIVKWYSNNDFVGNSNVLTWLLGRPPTSFESFARSTYSQLVAKSPAPG